VAVVQLGDVRHHSRMSQWKKVFLDTLLIICGVAGSMLFVGNGPNLLLVLAINLFVALICGLVSFAIAWFIRTVPISIMASIIVTDLIIVLYFVCRIEFSQQPHEHVKDELILLPMDVVVYTAPTVLLTCAGFGRFAGRLYQRASVNVQP